MILHIFGESHAPEIGVEIEGLPKGFAINLEELQAFLKRRAPGQGQGGLSTPRKETDEVIFKKGLIDGVTDGSTIRAIIKNTNIRPTDYEQIATIPRPGHADLGSYIKYGTIPSGGGKWSGRMTAPLCIAGGIALQLLKTRGVTISSKVTTKLKVSEGDSIGGIVEVVANNVPKGLGDAMDAGLESKLSAAFFALPAVKGVEFGDGFKLAEMKGSEANDAFEIRDGEVALRTNHCGGILGGITIGAPLVARLCFKPTPSIALEQDSVDLKTMKMVKLKVIGRHDQCVAFRGAVAAEAAMAVVLCAEIFG